MPSPNATLGNGWSPPTQVVLQCTRLARARCVSAAEAVHSKFQRVRPLVCSRAVEAVSACTDESLLAQCKTTLQVVTGTQMPSTDTALGLPQQAVEALLEPPAPTASSLEQRSSHAVPWMQDTAIPAAEVPMPASERMEVQIQGFQGGAGNVEPEEPSDLLSAMLSAPPLSFD